MSSTLTEPIVLGVVVDIPQPHAAVLTQWRGRVGDRQASIPPHVTLLPPTETDPGAGEEIFAHLQKAAATVGPFAMHLAGTGTFRPLSQVVFVQVASGIGECEQLADAIRSGPLTRELPFPYHPHVTVAQDVDDVALDAAYDGLTGFAARFTVAGFTAYARRDDGTWQPQQTFALGG